MRCEGRERLPDLVELVLDVRAARELAHEQAHEVGVVAPRPQHDLDDERELRRRVARRSPRRARRQRAASPTPRGRPPRARRPSSRSSGRRARRRRRPPWRCRRRAPPRSPAPRTRARRPRGSGGACRRRPCSPGKPYSPRGSAHAPERWASTVRRRSQPTPCSIRSDRFPTLPALGFAARATDGSR